MAGAVFRVFVAGTVSLTPIKQNKTLANFFSAPFGVSSIFLRIKSVYERNFATFLLGDYLIKIDYNISYIILYYITYVI